LFVCLFFDYSQQTPAKIHSRKENSKVEAEAIYQLQQEGNTVSLSQKSLQAILLLKQTLSPLQLDVDERLQKITQMEDFELRPIQVDISNSKIKLANITAELKLLENRDEIEFPLQFEQLTAYKEQLTTENFGYEKSINLLMLEGSNQLSKIQGQIRDKKADSKILSELLKWIVQELSVSNDWDQEFIYISSALSKLNDKYPSLASFLLQVKQRQQQANGKRITPNDVKNMVADLLTETNSQITGLEASYTNLTLSLGQEKSRLDSKIAENEVNYKQTINQMNQLHEQQKVVKESIANLEMKKSDEETQLNVFIKSQNEVKISWNYETEQLSEIQSSVNSILEMIQRLS